MQSTMCKTVGFYFLCFYFFVFSVTTARTQCLNGVYTIGGTFPDFTTFTDAVNAINTNGICGHVTFKVRNGLYNERLIIPAWLTSPTQTVTFVSEAEDSTTVVLHADSLYTVNNMASHLYFSKMTIENIGGSGCFLLKDMCDQVHIQHCVINNTIPFGSNAAVQLNNVKNIFIQRNSINSNACGVRIDNILSATNPTVYITQNEIAMNFGAYVGVLGFDVASVIVNKNVVNQGVYGISLDMASGGVQIGNNTITNVQCGVYCNDFDVTADTLKIYNNSINAIALSIHPGISVASIQKASIVNNTVQCNSTTYGAFPLVLHVGGFCTVQNNIFSNLAANKAFSIQRLASTTLVSDYNLYQTGGSTYIGDQQIGGPAVSYTNLTNYTALTGNDSHGIESNPLFVSLTNLHLSSGSPAIDAGLYVGVSNDIDGDVRILPIDIGADEYSETIGILDEVLINENVLIFPNPTNGMVHVKTKESQNKISIQLYNAIGERVGVFVSANEIFDFSFLTNGLYVLNIQLNNNLTIAKQLLIQH